MDDTPLESDFLVKMKVENPKMYADVIAARNRRKRYEAQAAVIYKSAANIDPVVRLPEEVEELQKEVALLKDDLRRLRNELQAEVQRIDERFVKAGKVINELRKGKR